MLYTNLLDVVQRFQNSQIGITECPYKDTLRLESKNEIDELLRIWTENNENNNLPSGETI